MEGSVSPKFYLLFLNSDSNLTQTQIYTPKLAPNLTQTLTQTLILTFQNQIKIRR